MTIFAEASTRFQGYSTNDGSSRFGSLTWEWSLNMISQIEGVTASENRATIISVRALTLGVKLSI